MADLNSNIILGYQQPQIAQQNPLANALGVAQIQAIRDKRDQEQRALDDQNRLRAILGAGGDGDALIRGGFIDQGSKLNKDKRDNAATEATTADKNADAFGKKMTQTNTYLNVITPENYSTVKNLIATNVGPEFAKPLPEVYDQAAIDSLRSHAIDRQKEIENARLAATQAEVARHNQAAEGIQVRGQNITASTAAADRAQRERSLLTVPTTDGGVYTAPTHMPIGSTPGSDIQIGQLVDRQGKPVVKAGAGGAAGDKLPVSQQNQLVATQNLGDAISNYRANLADWSKLDALSPAKRAVMGTAYNNMMLQAKDAYGLGVLNGNDYQILTSIVADPRSPQAALVPKSALDQQAVELERIMSKIGNNAAATRPSAQRAAAAGAAQSEAAPTSVGAPSPDIQSLLEKYRK